MEKTAKEKINRYASVLNTPKKAPAVAVCQGFYQNKSKNLHKIFFGVFKEWLIFNQIFPAYHRIVLSVP